MSHRAPPAAENPATRSLQPRYHRHIAHRPPTPHIKPLAKGAATPSTCSSLFCYSAKLSSRSPWPRFRGWPMSTMTVVAATPASSGQVALAPSHHPSSLSCCSLGWRTRPSTDGAYAGSAVRRRRRKAHSDREADLPTELLLSSNTDCHRASYALSVSPGLHTGLRARGLHPGGTRARA